MRLKRYEVDCEVGVEYEHESGCYVHYDEANARIERLEALVRDGASLAEYLRLIMLEWPGRPKSSSTLSASGSSQTLQRATSTAPRPSWKGAGMIRTILRRAILFPTIVPLAWTTIWFVIWLTEGAKEATDEALSFTRWLWRGDHA